MVEKEKLRIPQPTSAVLNLLRKIRRAGTDNDVIRAEIFKDTEHLIFDWIRYIFRTPDEEQSREYNLSSDIDWLLLKYKNYLPVITYTGISSEKLIHTHLKDLLQSGKYHVAFSFNVDPLRLRLDEKDLFSSKTLVYAPLATDYMIAALMRESIINQGDEPFMVKPALVNQFHTQCWLPPEPLDHYKRIIPFVDTIGGGTTLNCLAKEVKNRHYLSRIITM
ncbi:MAG: hypothetical protein Q7S61_05525 [bacterium]|nr:hypothetical protein [bacterium]